MQVAPKVLPSIENSIFGTFMPGFDKFHIKLTSPQQFSISNRKSHDSVSGMTDDPCSRGPGVMYEGQMWFNQLFNCFLLTGIESIYTLKTTAFILTHKY